jgi:phospholipid transport system transporter-binding protein
MGLVRDGKNRFRVDGDLTFESVPALWREGPAHFAGIAADTLTVDLTAVRRVDSGGLALLVSWVRWARRHGVQVRFRRPPESLLALARAAGLSPLLGLGEGRGRGRQPPVVT